MRAIVALTLRALVQRRRLGILIILLVMPAIVASIFVLSQTIGDGTYFAVGLFDNLMLPVLIPVTALILGSGALGNEIEDRTLVYLTLRPVSRLSIVTAKYLASVMVVAGLVEIAVLAMFAVASRKTVPDSLLAVAAANGPFNTGNALAGSLVAAFAGTAAYVALFLLLGVVMPRRGLLVGFAYVLGWEGAAAGLSGALATLSVRRYVQGTLDSWLTDAPLAKIGPTTAGATESVVALLLIVALSLVLCVSRLRRMELE